MNMRNKYRWMQHFNNIRNSVHEVLIILQDHMFATGNTCTQVGVSEGAVNFACYSNLNFWKTFSRWIDNRKD
jgi:hypothetical protein